MIYIITGEMDSGKTTKLQEVYQEKKQGDGFVSVKKMEGIEGMEYDILKLSTKEFKPFIYRSFNLPDNVEISCRIGDYHFSKVTTQASRLDAFLNFPLFLNCFF